MVNGNYNLINHNVLPNDTGVYTCVEETGFGDHHEISLTVSGFTNFRLLQIFWLFVSNTIHFWFQILLAF